MRNCEDRECINLVINNTLDNTRCKILDIKNPDDISFISCNYFKQSETCRLCKNGRLVFWVYEDMDFEEDYECILDPKIKTSYFTIEQSNSDYQCKCGKFEYLHDEFIKETKEDEKFISDSLVDIWNKFVSLEQTHPSDIEDFKRVYMIWKK